MTGVITTGAHPKALRPGVRKFVMGKYDEHPKEYAEIFDMQTSRMKYEEDVEIAGFPFAAIKDEAASISYASHSQGFTKRYTHVAYGLGYMLTREERDDNLYKQAFNRGEMLAFSFMSTKETVAANVLNRAFNSSFVGGDGKELLATDHPLKGGGTMSNELAVAADLSEASLEDLMIQIMEATNSLGHKIAVRPEKVIVAPANVFNADRIINSTLQSGTANNDKNAVRGRIPGGVVVNHYLTDDDAWFIKTNLPNGMMGFQRTPFEFDMDNDFDTKNLKFSGYERYVFGWTDPRGLYGSEGTA